MQRYELRWHLVLGATTVLVLVLGTMGAADPPPPQQVVFEVEATFDKVQRPDGFAELGGEWAGGFVAVMTQPQLLTPGSRATGGGRQEAQGFHAGLPLGTLFKDAEGLLEFMLGQAPAAGFKGTDEELQALSRRAAGRKVTLQLDCEVLGEAKGTDRSIGTSPFGFPTGARMQAPESTRERPVYMGPWVDATLVLPDAEAVSMLRAATASTCAGG